MSAIQYANQIDSISTEIKRLNDLLKKLRTEKKTAQSNLHDVMKKKGMNEIVSHKGNKITLKQCEPPKPRAKPKAKKDKQKDAIELFRNIGVPNPEQFYTEFQQTQKASPPD